ncbi:MAG: flagellar hook-associated protein FlgK [Mariniblastus sp.]
MNLWIGFSALQTSQFAINNVSQNVANASTEGYHRQEVGLQTSQTQRISGQLLGTGVEISEVKRFRDQVVEESLTNSISDLEAVNHRLQIESTIESLFLSDEGGIQNALTGMFGALERLTANPSEGALRGSALSHAERLTERIQFVSEELVGIKNRVNRQIQADVDSVNEDLKTLTELQNKIAMTEFQGTPNELLDQRDRLVNSLAERMDIQRFGISSNQSGLAIAGNSISLGPVAVEFETKNDADGNIEIFVVGSDRKVQFQSGKIAALTEVHNSLLGEYSEKIDEFASAMVQAFDQEHAKGVSLSGPHSVLQATRPVTNLDAPLSESSAFPIEEGELVFSVTSPDGNRRTESISIDPAVDSLRDIAAKISSIENIQAVVDEESNRLTIIARPQYGFDFTGNLETVPDLSNFSGSSVPQVTGQYTGKSNEIFSIEILGDGEIGKTPGLAAQVTDQNGNVIDEINVGLGYEAGSDIDLGNGISIQMGAGSVNTLDSFDVVAVADSDSTGVLASLGLNSFFEGTDATNISVRSDLRDNPDAIATTRTGEIGDTSNLANIVSIQDRFLLSDKQMTLNDFLGETGAEIGFRVQASESIQFSISEIHFQYQSDVDAVSGVDINEELLKLSRHQKSYEAAVQVVRTMETMLDELFQIIR